MMMSKPCPAARASVDWNSEMLRGWMMTYSIPKLLHRPLHALVHHVVEGPVAHSGLRT